MGVAFPYYGRVVPVRGPRKDVLVAAGLVWDSFDAEEEKLNVCPYSWWNCDRYPRWSWAPRTWMCSRGSTLGPYRRHISRVLGGS